MHEVTKSPFTSPARLLSMQHSRNLQAGRLVPQWPGLLNTSSSAISCDPSECSMTGSNSALPVVSQVQEARPLFLLPSYRQSSTPQARW